MPSANAKAEMESEIPKKNVNFYQIAGLPVHFPYKPYGSQLAFMGRVISTLDRAQRQGHCHALLESPTGTGKSLSLLCSALAWQQNHLSRNLHATPSTPPAHDPYVSGGGFVPDPNQTGNNELSQTVPNSRTQRKRITPTIYYASRTHSQISQVIREYRKTTYRVPMAVLAARKYYCTNKHVCTKENVDEECKMLLKDEVVGCSEFKNANKLKAHPSLQKGGCLEVHDIEDLVKVGQVVKGCSYFAACSMATEAQLVFCPYNYIINPVIRRALELDINGAIVILDEAHNIEDMTRDAGSLDMEEELLDLLQTELGQLCSVENIAPVYQPLYDMIQGITSWIGQRKDNLQKWGFEHYLSSWTGDRALRELQEAGISQQCFPIVQECAAKAIKAAADAHSEKVHLSGKSATILEGLFSSLSYFFSENGHHAFDYQLALQRYVKRDSGHAGGSWKYSLSLWCLNPAVVFKEIAGLSLSVILTSGTLSPMGSLASELGVQFEACMEAPHVIDVDSQLLAAVVSTGPGNCQLNASYKTADGYAFQDSLGAALEEICKIVPGGALVFFPSYKLLEKLQKRWVETGQWSKLHAEKSIFVEPRGNQEDFEPVLKDYYDSIRGASKRSIQEAGPRKIKRIRKQKSDNKSIDVSQQDSAKGAAFLAVFRGKVSEGIDFSDDNARVVVIVGIPFPNKTDIQVVLKKKYNDTYKSSKNLLSGSEWYCHQAFRALNQAAGRCIRHRFDYGAIIFIDERYKEERNITFISKWLRKSIKQYENFDKSLEGLRTFFLDAKERFSQKNINVVDDTLETTDNKMENLATSYQDMLCKGTQRRRNQKINKHDNHKGRNTASDKNSTEKTGKKAQLSTAERKDHATLSHSKAQESHQIEAYFHPNGNDFGTYGKNIDLQFSSPKDSRPSGTVSISSSNCSLEHCATSENPAIDGHAVGSRIVSEDKDLHASKLQSSSPFSDQVSFHSATTTNFSTVVTEGVCTYAGAPERKASACILAVTPERKVIRDDFNMEKESCFISSVNSCNQKRRKRNQFGQPDSLCLEESCTDDTGSMHGSRCLDSNLKENCKSKDQQGNVRLSSRNNGALSISSKLDINKKLHICCTACREPLGLPENNFLVTCSSTSSSKPYVSSLWSPDSLSKNEPCCVSVLIADFSSITKSLHSFSPVKGAPECGIWCEEDGCVFRKICCPFCTTSKICLGLQVLAADASNVHLLNKIILCADLLEIKDHEATMKEPLVNGPGTTEISRFSIFDKFAYAPPSNEADGWITTKSKLRLPKR